MLHVLRRDGALATVANRLASFGEFQRVVAKDVWDQLESRYRAEA